MGGGGYDRSIVSTDSSCTGYSAAAEATLAKNRGLHPNLDPKHKTVNCTTESCVVCCIDVTGSMTDWPKIIWDKLPMFYGQLLLQGYVTDPSISFCAFGDAHHDRAPLQVSDFAQGSMIDGEISGVFIEGGGGSGYEESYELALYYYARHCSKTTPKARSFFFITGDEKYYPTVFARQVKSVIGEELPGDLPTEQIFAEIREKFNLFFIAKPHSSVPDEVYAAWEKVVGAERVLRVSTAKAVIDVMLGAIAMCSGRTLASYEDDLVARGQDEQRQREVQAALHALPVSGTSGPRMRPCAGAIIVNSQGQMLVGERNTGPEGPRGKLQFPQGGVERGETPEAAARREAREELGLQADLTLVGSLPKVISYEVPEGTWLRKTGWAGQTMYWYVFRWDGDLATACNVASHADPGEQPEFLSCQWVSDFGQLIASQPSFKRPMYEELAVLVPPMIARALNPS